MAQHNTDYGLVYDDEGKICVTKRTDIIPFSGVTSYAVETATTNLIGHTNGRFNSVSGGGTTPPTVELVSKKTPWGNEAWKVTIPANNDTGYNGCRATTNSFPITAGTYYSYFTYVLFEGSLQPSDLYIYPTGTAGMGNMALDSSRNIGSWQYFSRENATPSLTGSDYFTYYATTTSTVARTFYIAVGQFEQKPFCSSFVIGSRPAGRLVVDVEDLGFNPGTDDWVVHYWKYPVATLNNSLTSYNCFVIGHYTPDYTQGYILWGKNTNKNQFILAAHLSDNTRSISYSSIFDSDWYFRHWHHEVLLKHGNELQYWVDGTLQIQVSLTTTLNSNFILGMAVGGDDTNQPHNSYIANLCYGKYTDQWTPEYIQEIYQQRNGFFVPPKAVIV